MMNDKEYFYWQSIRRTVAVFGTLFNNIEVVRKDSSGKVLNIQRVPLSYGPKQKFLARIDQVNEVDGPSAIAIKLPRMSFEIISMDYDSNHKMQKMHFERFPTDEKDLSVKDWAVGPVPYNMAIELSIIAKNQDDALQVMEQILPWFQPQYTVTVKELKGNTKSDYPFTLNSVAMEDSYQGDFLTRRAIIYTLTFTTKVRFYGSVQTHPLIKKVDINYNIDDNQYDSFKDMYIVVPWESGPEDNYEVKRLKTFSGIDARPYATVGLDSVYNISVNDVLIGTAGAMVGNVISIDAANNTVDVGNLDGEFDINESLYIPTKPGNLYIVSSFNGRWTP